MLTIETRQNQRGRWWCNTTYLYDYFEEADTITEARRLIIETLKKAGYNGEVEWSIPKLYPVIDPPILHEYRTHRIDKGMVQQDEQANLREEGVTVDEMWDAFWAEYGGE